MFIRQANFKKHSMDIIHAIKERIYNVRNEWVMLDRDLALLYRIEDKEFIKEIRAHSTQLTNDLMFSITKFEWEELGRLRNISTLKNLPGQEYFSKKIPNAFTEQGVLVLSGIFHSAIAVKINIAVVQAFTEIKRRDS